ncbi:MAG: glycosyltransferase, partial [Chloroflexi bacterium]|nr:glycosyltransferase [Chloroflexota bacterium]
VFGRPYHPEYYQLLQRLAVGKRVRFVTEGSDADLVREYQTSAVTVLPSVFTDVYGSYYPAPELLGLTLLESMACGTPVVCTDGGPGRELVEDGVTGYVVPPNDPKALGERIACLLDDAARAAAMGRLGRERVLERFTWQAVAERCLDIYQGAAGHDGAAPGRSSGRSRGRHG